MEGTATGAAPAYPPRGRAWASAIVIFVITVIAMADRMAISMLIGPIKGDFGIGDFQASLLVGLAFTLFYIVFLMPIGMLADRWSRKNVLAICLLIWSLATMACGLAGGFVSLFILRMLVGAGEAGLAPGAHGIIGASFPREALAKPLALQGVGFQVGAAVGVAGAGAVLGAGAAGAFDGMPLIGGMEPWRIAFFAIGLPGMLALLLVPLLYDPKSNHTAPVAGSAGGESLMTFLRANSALVALALISAGTSAIALGSITGWVPEYVQRSLGVSPMVAGATMGMSLLIAAFASQMTYSFIVDWLAGRGMLDAPIRIGLLPMALAIPASWFAFSADTAETFWPALFVLLLCITPSNALNNTLIQMIAPAHLRSRLAALLIFVISVIGFAGGPAIVGALSQYVFGEAHLGTALRWTNVIAMAVTFALLVVLRGRLARFMAARGSA